MDTRSMTWREELAWAAGVFDGEGCFSSARDKATSRPRTHLAIGQTETTMLRRVQRAFGFGAVRGPYGGHGRNKPYFQFIVNTFEEAQAALAMMWPFLGEPKRRQASAVFQAVKDYMEIRRREQDARLEVCPYGHKKSHDIPILVGKSYGRSRKCKECGERAERRWRANNPGHVTKWRATRRAAANGEQ